MKKVITVFLLAMVLALNAEAQRFQLGIKGGVNISNFTGSSNLEGAKEKSLVGFHAGGFVNFGLGKNFSIQPEVLLSSQGAKIDSAGQSDNFKVTYINIPVLAKYRFDGGFYIEAGPQFGFLVDENIGKSTINDFANSTDISVAVGLGFHSSMGLGIGARYTAGLSKVSDFDWGTTQPDYKNSVLQFSIFYTLFNKRD
jgi:Outer membrane protein beta-barrel domain